ncbi:hypothetical protein [Methylobacterium sp. 77]|uniref:hypothetical protein n=1 Tax=Methylobacterium sp. 77 TaxID=1101192 RepID=UPI00039DA3C2|nr:hypothetical protein [Methylobacterium sp. 77]
MPALDLAFGLDRETDLPENMAALIAKLDAGPLGVRSQGPSPSIETEAPDLAAAASGMSRWVVPACEPA